MNLLPYPKTVTLMFPAFCVDCGVTTRNAVEGPGGGELPSHEPMCAQCVNQSWEDSNA